MTLAILLSEFKALNPAPGILNCLMIFSHSTPGSIIYSYVLPSILIRKTLNPSYLDTDDNIGRVGGCEYFCGGLTGLSNPSVSCVSMNNLKCTTYLYAF